MIARFVQLFVRSVLVVPKRDLLTLLDCRIDDLDVVKQSLIIRLAPFVYRPNVFDVRTEVLVGKRTQLFDKFFRMLSRYVFACKHAVDKQAKLGIFKLARNKIASAAVRQNIIPCVFQKKDVAADRLALDNDAEISVEIAGNIFLDLVLFLSFHIFR